MPTLARRLQQLACLGNRREANNCSDDSNSSDSINSSDTNNTSYASNRVTPEAAGTSAADHDFVEIHTKILLKKAKTTFAYNQYTPNQIPLILSFSITLFSLS
jgi:hypothetical protein